MRVWAGVDVGVGDGRIVWSVHNRASTCEHVFAARRNGAFFHADDVVNGEARFEQTDC